MKAKHLKAGLIFALNYHGIDAKADQPDWSLAALLLPEMLHGIRCSKAGGLDPAWTAHSELALRTGAQSEPSMRKEIEQLRAERVTLQSENEQLRADLEAAKQAAKPAEIKIGDTVRLKEGAKSVYGTPLFVAPSYVVDNAFAGEKHVELHIRQAEAEPGNGGWWVARDQIAEVIR